MIERAAHAKRGGEKLPITDGDYPTVERSPGSLTPLVGEGGDTSFGRMGVSYILC